MAGMIGGAAEGAGKAAETLAAVPIAQKWLTSPQGQAVGAAVNEHGSSYTPPESVPASASGSEPTMKYNDSMQLTSVQYNDYKEVEAVANGTQQSTPERMQTVTEGLNQAPNVQQKVRENEFNAESGRVKNELQTRGVDIASAGFASQFYMGPQNNITPNDNQSGKKYSIDQVAAGAKYAKENNLSPSTHDDFENYVKAANPTATASQTAGATTSPTATTSLAAAVAEPSAAATPTTTAAAASAATAAAAATTAREGASGGKVEAAAVNEGPEKKSAPTPAPKEKSEEKPAENPFVKSWQAFYKLMSDLVRSISSLGAASNQPKIMPASNVYAKDKSENTSEEKTDLTRKFIYGKDPKGNPFGVFNQIAAKKAAEFCLGKNKDSEDTRLQEAKKNGKEDEFMDDVANVARNLNPATLNKPNGIEEGYNHYTSSKDTYQKEQGLNIEQAKKAAGFEISARGQDPNMKSQSKIASAVKVLSAQKVNDQPNGQSRLNNASNADISQTITKVQVAKEAAEAAKAMAAKRATAAAAAAESASAEQSQAQSPNRANTPRPGGAHPS
jgi:hypothetical protein